MGTEISNQEGEVWKTHPKYSNYLISTRGRVIGPSGKVLKATVQVYPRVTITTEEGQVYRNVHVLMSETFLGRTTEITRHLNDIKWDNRLENLALGTPQDNSDDAVANGRAGVKEYCSRGHKRVKPNLTNGLACRACGLERSQAERDGRPFCTERADEIATDLLSGTWKSSGPRSLEREGWNPLVRKVDIYEFETKQLDTGEADLESVG